MEEQKTIVISARLRPPHQRMRNDLHAIGYSDTEIIHEGVRRMHKQKCKVTPA